MSCCQGSKRPSRFFRIPPLLYDGPAWSRWADTTGGMSARRTAISFSAWPKRGKSVACTFRSSSCGSIPAWSPTSTRAGSSTCTGRSRCSVTIEESWDWKNIRSYVYSDGRRKSVSGYVGLLIDLLSRKEGRRAIWYRIAENRCSYELARQYDGMKSTVGGNDARWGPDTGG